MRKVFLSSTAKDLAPYRAAVVEALRKIDRVDVQWMVDWVSQDASSLQLCEDRVRGADLFVGLIGHCFGTAPPEAPQRSYTMLEWDWACDAGLPRLMHLAPSSFSMPHDVMAAETPEGQALQSAFREQDLAGTHAGQPDAWQNPDRLATHVVIAVSQKLAEMEADTQPGFSKAGLEADLYRRLLELTEERERTAEDRATLDQEKAAVEAKLADLDQSYAQAQETIAGLEADLARYGNTLDPAIRDAAEQAIDAGDFDAAERAYAKITDHGEMEIKRTAAAYFQRGKIAEEQIRWQDARRHYDRAAELDPSADHHSRAARIALRLGDYTRAEAIVRLGLEISKAEKNDFETSNWLNNLGLCCHQQGRNEEAETHLRQAIAMTLATLGEHHHEYATRLNNLGCVLRDLHRPTEAEPLFRQAIEIDKKTIGQQHSDYAIHLNNLAYMLRDMGQLQEAEPLFREAIEIDEATIGTGHPDYAIHLNNLATLLLEMGNPLDAEPHAHQAQRVLEAALGDEHPSYNLGLNALGRIHQALGREDEAREIFGRAIPRLQQTLGTDHALTRTVAARRAAHLLQQFPKDPELAELQATFGADIGKD